MIIDINLTAKGYGTGACAAGNLFFGLVDSTQAGNGKFEMHGNPPYKWSFVRNIIEINHGFVSPV